MNAITARYLHKAGRAIDAAESLLAAGDADFAASRSYYVMLYICDALLNEQGVRLIEHAKVHDALRDRFVEPGLLDPRFHQWIVDAFETRLVADYSVEAPFPAGDAARVLDRARDFLEEGRRFLGADG